MTKWHTQEVSFTNNIKVELYFTVPELSVTKIITWNFHANDSDKGIYDMVLERDLLRA